MPSILEWVAVVFSMISVVLTIKKNIWLWPTGIIGIVAFVAVFWQQRLYGDVALQIVFLAQSIYGWYFWIHPKPNEVDVPITALTSKEGSWFLGVSVLLTIGWSFWLAVTPDPMPFWDSAILWFSVVAQWLLMKKKYDNWNYWIIVNIISIYVYFAKGLNLTAIEYIIFLGLCLLGRSQWKLKTNNFQLEWF